MSYSKEELAAYRLQRAHEALEEANVMVSIQHWNTAANRLYYACFYAASAYLIYNGLEGLLCTVGQRRRLIKN
ncbi:MAG: HEPN domain-containing protein [Saprospiraceae bacterium]|nr:HEPN domain-containing protein [Saprospiraceae bacterium]